MMEQVERVEACEGRARRLSAVLRKYYVSEVRPVRFGAREDASSAIGVMAVTLLLVHGGLLLLSWATGSGVWRDYTDSHQFLVAMLLYVWLTGFHVISLTVHYRFERGEHMGADDLYIVQTERDGERPLLVALPDARLAVAISDTDRI